MEKETWNDDPRHGKTYAKRHILVHNNGYTGELGWMNGSRLTDMMGGKMCPDSCMKEALLCIIDVQFLAFWWKGLLCSLPVLHY